MFRKRVKTLVKKKKKLKYQGLGPRRSFLTSMQKQVCIEAALEGKPSSTLSTVKGLFNSCSMDGLVGFELQQIAEGFLAVFTAQGLLTLAALLHSASVRL